MSKRPGGGGVKDVAEVVEVVEVAEEVAAVWGAAWYCSKGTFDA